MDQVTEIVCKQDMSRFAHAHELGPITWVTHAGPGGTIVVVEHVEEKQ